MFFINPIRAQNQQNNIQNSPIESLAREITEIALFPIKAFVTLLLLPVIIPLAIMHTFVAISINTMIFFIFVTAASAMFLTASQIIAPIGLIALLLISLIGINTLQNLLNEMNQDFGDFLRNFTIL